jgi:hypothetical protein
VKPLHPLSPEGAATHAARFFDGLRAWWWPAPSEGKARAHAGEEREAVHRWEDEGGNVR